MTTVIRIRDRIRRGPLPRLGAESLHGDGVVGTVAHAPPPPPKPRPKDHGHRGWTPRLRDEIRGLFSGFGEV